MQIDINRVQATSEASPEDPKGCNRTSGTNVIFERRKANLEPLFYHDIFHVEHTEPGIFLF